MSSGFHFFNEEFIEKEKCFLHVSDLSIQRAFAVFDYFIFIDNVPLYFEDNLIRFRNSIASMNLSLDKTDADLKKIIVELIKKNGTPDGGIKLIFSGGYASNGYDAESPNLILMHLPFPKVADIHFEKGIKLILEEFERNNPEAKTTDYFFVLSVKEKIKSADAFDVLYHKDGCITESSRSNFFVIDHDNNIITSDKGVLKGITRQKLIDAVQGEYQIIERPIYTSELTNVKEAFMTSSVKRVIPVTQIDDLIIGDGAPGDVTKHLMAILKAADQKYIKTFNNMIG